MSSAVPANDPVIDESKGVPRRPWRITVIARHIAYNWVSKLRQASGRMGSSIGATHENKSLEESLDYLDRVYRDYVFYGGLTEEHLRGARVLELGPGDNFGVALQFLTAGAAKVVALDKFVTNRRTEHAAGIYRAMRARLTGSDAENFDRAVRLVGGVEFSPDRFEAIEGIATEDADRKLAPGSFDLIVSRAVLEEIHEIDRVFRSMHTLLAPGGRMIHKIDLRDYGMFSRHGMHPLEFLTIPQPLYTLMTEYSGHPNRRRADYYRAKLREMKYFAAVLVTGIAGQPGEVLPHKPGLEYGVDYTERSLELVRTIRPRLARPFRNLSDADLLVSGIFLVAQKPE